MPYPTLCPWTKPFGCFPPAPATADRPEERDSRQAVKAASTVPRTPQECPFGNVRVKAAIPPTLDNVPGMFIQEGGRHGHQSRPVGPEQRRLDGVIRVDPAHQSAVGRELAQIGGGNVLDLGGRRPVGLVVE